MLLLFDVALFECEVCRPGSLLSHNAAIMIPIALFCLNAFYRRCGVPESGHTGHRDKSNIYGIFIAVGFSCVDIQLNGLSGICTFYCHHC